MSASGLTLVLLAVAGITASAPAASVEAAFGNTIVTTYPDGKSTRTWLHPDGTYDALRANGDRTGGVWKIKNGELCISQKRPVYVPLVFCTAIVPGGVGTSWNARGLLGQPVRNTLVPGRQG